MKIVCTKLEFAALIRSCADQKDRLGCEECLIYGFCEAKHGIENEIEIVIKEVE